MEFVLNEYHRNIPDEDLIADLKRVAGIKKKPQLQKMSIWNMGSMDMEP